MVNKALLRETNGSYTLNIFVSAIFWVTVTVFMSGGSVFVRLTIVTTYSHCNSLPFQGTCFDIFGEIFVFSILSLLPQNLSKPCLI